MLRSINGVLTVAGGRCRIFNVTTQIFLKSTWNYKWPVEGYSCPYFVSDQSHNALRKITVIQRDIKKSCEVPLPIQDTGIVFSTQI